MRRPRPPPPIAAAAAAIMILRGGPGRPPLSRDRPGPSPGGATRSVGIKTNKNVMLVVWPAKNPRSSSADSGSGPGGGCTFCEV